MPRTIDGIVARKKPTRSWRFRKRTPDLSLVYVAPSPTMFSPWTKQLGVLVALLLSPALAFSFSTNAAFSDDDRIRSNGIGTGEWMPDIHLEEKHGCMKLFSSVSSAHIYYKFSDDGDPRTHGVLFDGKCIKIPNGKHVDFEARAFNPDNDDWRSDVFRKTFSQKSDDEEKDDDSYEKKSEEERDDKEGTEQILDSSGDSGDVASFQESLEVQDEIEGANESSQGSMPASDAEQDESGVGGGGGDHHLADDSQFHLSPKDSAASDEELPTDYEH